mmetsp:Transcript_50959/g.124161  ORF Transcript_50959/g.124161 Transcript_50959/m.124161 type:complete len:426 (-) Transcript_50959:821-2098(-)
MCSKPSPLTFVTRSGVSELHLLCLGGLAGPCLGLTGSCFGLVGPRLVLTGLRWLIRSELLAPVLLRQRKSFLTIVPFILSIAAVAPPLGVLSNVSPPLSFSAERDGRPGSWCIPELEPSSLGLRIQNVFMGPLPLISMMPLLCSLTACLPGTPGLFWRDVAASLEQWMRSASLLLSMREAVLTVSPKRQYRGLRLPTMLATTGPVWKPTRMLTVPLVRSSLSIGTWRAAETTSRAKRAIRSAWLCWFLTRFVTPIQASPIVSTLKTSWSWARVSNTVYRRSSMSATFCGGRVELMFVKPTISEKKMVTESLYSGCTFCPARSCLTMCSGNTSDRRLVCCFLSCPSFLSERMYVLMSPASIPRSSLSMSFIAGLSSEICDQHLHMSTFMRGSMPSGTGGLRPAMTSRINCVLSLWVSYGSFLEKTS